MKIGEKISEILSFFSVGGKNSKPSAWSSAIISIFIHRNLFLYSDV